MKRNHCHGPWTGCIAQSIDTGPHDTIKRERETKRQTDWQTKQTHWSKCFEKPAKGIASRNCWICRRINVLSQKKSKSWITWPHRDVCLSVDYYVRVPFNPPVLPVLPIVLAQLWMTPQNGEPSTPPKEAKASLAATCHLPIPVLTSIPTSSPTATSCHVWAGFKPIHASLSCQCLGIIYIVCVNALSSLFSLFFFVLF